MSLGVQEMCKVGGAFIWKRISVKVSMMHRVFGGCPRSFFGFSFRCQKSIIYNGVR